MALILPVHILLSLTLLQALHISSLPEEAYLGYPLQGGEDYIYLDSRADPNYSSASSFIKQSETRRRSILDKNFARFGRSGYNPMKTKLLNINPDPEMKYLDEDRDTDSFGRSSRSGEKSDQFIRFGRGKSDFVRFGRSDPYSRNRDFIRFGRSTRSVKNSKKEKEVANNKKHLKMGKHEGNLKAKMPDGFKEKEGRKKRSAALDFYKKGGSNYVRFGRGDRNDNFMRFGRLVNDNYHNGQGNTNLNGNKSLGGDENKNLNGNTNEIKKYLEELQNQQSHELLLKMLVDVLTRNHLQKELQHQIIESNKDHGKENSVQCS